MGMEVLGAIGLASGAVLSFIALVTYVVRLMRKVSRQLESFREDWYGEAARPGRAAVPGVPERLAGIEKELKTNGGSSLRDQLGRVENRVNAVEKLVINQGSSQSA